MTRVAMLLSNALTSDPRVEKEAAALSSAGYEVTVYAWNRGGDLPAKERRGPIEIVRLGPPSVHGGGLRNVGGYREFWREAAEAAAAGTPAVVHCHDLDTAPAGLRVKRETGAKLVLDSHELYRESNMVPQRGAVGVAARTGVRAVERRVIPNADAVLVANPGTVGYYDRFGVGGRLTVIENAPDSEMFRPRETGDASPREVAAHAAACDSRPFTVGYFGQKRYLGGLLALIEAIQPYPDIHAVLAGGGTAAEAVATAAASAERVEVRGAFAYAELPAYYEACDAVYAVYEAGIGNVRTLFPVKVMEAMACGLPSIAAAGTWAGDYVERERVGLAVPPGDVDALRDALVRLRDDDPLRADMGRRGRAIVEAGLNWQSVARRLLDVYAGLLR